ncbi:hypothetical protein GQ457_02G041810 [Hibiscus cannabinus]
MEVSASDRVKAPNRQELQQRWLPPSPEIIKINCDASFDSITGNVGACAIARDCSGAIIAGDTSSFKALSASAAEAFALRVGVCLAIVAGFHEVQLESDNAGVISRIVSKSFSSWDSTSIEEDIVSLALPFPNFSFSYVSRSCNMAVDWVARNARVDLCPHDWFSVVPSGLMTLL